MPYTQPTGNAIAFTWQGLTGFTAPAGNALSFSFVPPAVGGGIRLPALRSSLRAPWQAATPRPCFVRARMPPMAPLDTRSRNPWHSGRFLNSVDVLPWAKVIAREVSAVSPWPATAPVSTAADWVVIWEQAHQADREWGAPWAQYTTQPGKNTRLVWALARADDIDTLAPWAQHLAHIQPVWVARNRASRPAELPLRSPWNTFTRRLDPGWGVVTPDNQPPVDVHGTLITPILRSYLVLNEVTLLRTSNSLSLPVLALSLSADAESWTYTWSATLPGDRLDDVLPASPGAPIEFTATFNGWPHRLLAEKISLDRSHSKTRIALSGRGLAAQLSAPYAASEARHNTAARTAQQLCADALLQNGVPLDWAVVWNLTDWLVPAGAWVTLGTPIDAIDAIAKAAGGYLRPDPNTKTLHIEPRYPIAPWDWPTATPDYQLPAAATTKVAIEWRENPAYNAVYVAGSGAGAILAYVKRTGTAGDRVAPMVTDALITHANAARQRGLSILGSAGSGQTLTLETPVLEAIGIYPVGSLLRFVDGASTRLGLVRGVTVSANLPKVRQTLEVECHG